MTSHTPVPCSVKNCADEASYWIANFGGRDTFYLCSEHNPENDGIYSVIETDGSITRHEVAVYACADDCPDCN